MGAYDVSDEAQPAAVLRLGRAPRHGHIIQQRLVEGGGELRVVAGVGAPDVGLEVVCAARRNSEAGK